MKPKYSLRSQIIENSFWNIFASITNRLGGLIFIIIISRALMPEGFGVYALATTIAIFFVTFADLGINQTLTRYVAHEIDKNNQKAAAYFKYLLKIKIFLTLLISLILLTMAYPISFYILKNPLLFPLLMILSIYVFFTAIEGFYESLFYIQKNVKYISLKEIIFQSLRISSALIVAYFLISAFKLVGILIFSAAISIAILFIVIKLLRKIFPILFQKTEVKINKKEILKFVFSLNIQGISLIILSQTAIIILGIFLASRYIGYYNSALVIVSSIASLLTFTPILLPILTQIQKKRFEIALKKVFRILMIIIIPISAGLAVLAKYFIVLIYGHNYLPAQIPLQLLSFLIIPLVGTNLFLISFSARGKPKEFVKLTLLSTFVFLVLNIVLIKYFLAFSSEMAMVGAAIAALLSWFFYFFMSAWLLRSKLNVNIISFWLIKPVISSFLMSALVLYLIKMFNDINLIKGIILVISGTAVYLLAMILLKGIKKEEIGLIKELNLLRR